jgi:hypothetical protein
LVFDGAQRAERRPGEADPFRGLKMPGLFFARL